MTNEGLRATAIGDQAQACILEWALRRHEQFHRIGAAIQDFRTEGWDAVNALGDNDKIHIVMLLAASHGQLAMRMHERLTDTTK